ncbi:MAG: CHAT domain-containing protein [Synechococcaceae cyanobacterium RL_1_2]|nr:CHAT domain-containing protein [Synechococcaceae cyanobacterium RL_1_2]
MFEEFQVYINSITDDEYLIRTERAESGVPIAEERVKWSVDTWLNQSRVLFHDPLVKLLQQNGNSRYVEEKKSRLMVSAGDTMESSPDLSGLELKYAELGLSLYNAVFNKTVKDSLIIAKGIANHNRSILRLRLGSRDERILSLPWELMMEQESPGQSRLVSTGPEVIFSRYQERSFLGNSNIFKHLNHDLPVRILMVIAGPDDQENLQLKTEATYLREELKSQRGDGSHAIELDILEQPSREELIEFVEQKHYQVFHYSGHSNASRGGNLYLVSKSSGLTETLRGEELAGLLANNGIQLAVLNSCNSGDDISIPNTNDSSLSRILIKRGIPAVIAMAAKIPDQVALILTRILYRNLNMGYPVDFCLTRARQGLMSAYGAQQMYWALPILYLDPLFDGLLVNNDPITNDYNSQSYESNLEDKSLSLQEQLIMMAAEEAENLSKTMEAINPNFAKDNHKVATDISFSPSMAPVGNGVVMAKEETPPPSEPEESLFADLKTEVPQSPATPGASPDEHNETAASKFSYRHLELSWAKKQLKWKVLGVSVVVLALGGIGFWVWQKVNSSLPNAEALNLPLKEIDSLSTEGDRVSLAKVDTSLVTSVGISELEKGNIERVLNM